MAKTQVAKTELSSVVYDEVLDTPKGPLRVILDLSTFEKNTDRYHKWLMWARNLPRDLDSISGVDPIVVFLVMEEAKKPEEQRVSNSEVLRMAQLFYQEQIETAYQEAAVLAICAHADNQFDFIPESYDESPDEDLPGMLTMPPVRRNLNNPTELRLKQIMDILESSPVIAYTFQSRLQQATVELTRKAAAQTNEAGFQSK